MGEEEDALIEETEETVPVNYIKIGGYWFCNDFTRFWRLVLMRVPIIWVSELNPQDVRISDYHVFGRQKYLLKQKFYDKKYRFIDPENVVNPITKIVKPVDFTGEWEWGIPPETRFESIRTNLDYIIAECGKIYS